MNTDKRDLNAFQLGFIQKSEFIRVYPWLKTNFETLSNENDPFQIMTRLLEESGELAQMVNHFEGTGIKLAKEIMDLLRCSLQIAIYYGVERELATKIDEAYEKMKVEGLIELG